MPVRLPEGIDAAFAAATRDGVQGMAIVSSTATIAYRAPLASCRWRTGCRRYSPIEPT
jgi:hypothetical protein